MNWLKLSRQNLEACSSGETTYWPKDLRKRPDVIDFFVLNILPRTRCQITNVNDLSSDHFPVLLTLSASPTLKLRQLPLVTRATDWDLFCSTVAQSSEHHLTIPNTTALDESVCRLTHYNQQPNSILRHYPLSTNHPNYNVQPFYKTADKRVNDGDKQDLQALTVLFNNSTTWSNENYRSPATLPLLAFSLTLHPTQLLTTPYGKPLSPSVVHQYYHSHLYLSKINGSAMTVKK